MSVRRSREDEVEDERDKSNYRGVGLAAAVIAVGVGVGAALYYFLNKRSENNPQAGGSSQNWRCDDTLLREDQEARRLQAFRERSWTLEECSICFDVILKNQEVMSLPCTHQFHAACVMPWLQQSQTCPNCRKSID
ncbi:E3 ubiquitin-protein ligase SIRP1-like isoform X2 [Aricia agestis]|uniref:E3 ubiquitin-protein ligase SIRP1-like isoform X2 n=1 Tax=Aricia agestis TaxID=91739 RepID=UPI001C20697C|nr:E3 ubiquitin-protein ligase SIRP1-like isoform X2 [Aricia agestis]